MPGVVNSGDLLFGAASTASTDLVFGAGQASPNDRLAFLEATLPGLSLVALAGPVELASLEASLPAPALAGLVVATVDASLEAALPGPTMAALLVPNADLALDAVLPAPTLTALVSVAERVELDVALPGLNSLTASLRYNISVQRPVASQKATAWQQAIAAEHGSSVGQQSAGPSPVGWGLPWQDAVRSSQPLVHPLPSVFRPAPQSRASRHQAGLRRQDERHCHYQNAVRVHQARGGLHQDAVPLQRDTIFRHQDGDHTKRASRDGRWQPGLALGIQQGDGYRSARVFVVGRTDRFQEGIPPPSGLSGPNEPPFPPHETCYTPSGDLVFSLPLATDGALVFVCEKTGPAPKPSIVVPVRRVYIVLNNLSLRRVADNAEVPALRMSLSLDADSWTWGFNADLPESAQALVEPDTGPIELKANINGTEFRVLAENLSRERTFGQSSIKVTGRGRNAQLAAPYAPVMNFTNADQRTSQQLMADVLTLNGIPLGFTIDWGLTPWTVPAGVFNQQGTYVEALAAIAQAGGGYLIPHPADLSFKVRHRYPVAPWNWGTVTPDYVLPADAVTRESLEWKEKPAYNRVFVSGQQVGVLGQVTRAGTPGDAVAPMVVDPLITEAVAARQRGIAILGDTGRQILVTLSLPVLAETGVIPPGSFVGYVDGLETRIGLVRSTSVQAGMPEVWQTLGVETHA